MNFEGYRRMKERCERLTVELAALQEQQFRDRLDAVRKLTEAKLENEKLKLELAMIKAGRMG